MPVPRPVRWTIQWYLFRIMMGAGLIKLKSADRKWKDLTSMNYFYETQPVPNPLTRYMHWMPAGWHKFEVLTNHFVELVSPWLLIIPAMPVGLRRFGAVVQLAFQAMLIVTGNLSFLNWLTMVPAIMSLDDAFVGRWFSSSQQYAASQAALKGQLSLGRRLVSWLFLALILQLSVPVVKNLCARRQLMNTSFDPLRLVNSYGAFGVVGERREELIVSASTDLDDWKEYEFKVKPGSVTRGPRWISPYHYRLDWQMWIAAQLRLPDRSPWVYSFLAKLLRQEQQVLELLESDPWKDSTETPKYVRVDMFEYRFHKATNNETNPSYWDRRFLRRFYPRQGIATIDSLKSELAKL